MKPVIMHLCLSDGWGGLEMYPVRIGSRLYEAGYQVYGVCLENTQVNRRMEQAGIGVFSSKSKSNLISCDFFRLIRWIRTRKITILHCHKSGDLLVARMISLFCPVRVVFTEHMGSRRNKKDLFHRWVYQCVDLVLSVSHETYQRNIKALPVAADRVSCLWQGTEIPDQIMREEQELNALKQKYNIPVKGRVIGSVGRLCDGKGFIELVRAFALIEKQYPEVSLVIAGGITPDEGCGLSYLQRLQEEIASYQLTQKVIFTGFVQDVQQIFAIMDIVCLPYANEAFGLTAIEAMAAQKPIVGANTGALPEVFGETALLCDPLSFQEIAGSLQQLIKHPDLASDFARQARKRAIARFSIETHMTELAIIYANLSNEDTVLQYRT